MKLILLKTLKQFVIPIIILQAVAFKLLNDSIKKEFINYNDVTIYKIFIFFISVQAVNAFLIMTSHKLKRAYFHLLVLQIAMFSFFAYSFILYGSFKSFSELGFLFDVFETNSYFVLLFQFLFIIAVFFIWRNETNMDHTGYLFKIGLYFMIPTIFYFTSQYALSFITERYCLHNHFRNDNNDLKRVISNTGLIGTKITAINSFSAFTFLPNRTYLVYLMDSKCESCIRNIENVLSFKNMKTVNEVIFFDVAPPESKNDVINFFSIPKEINFLSLNTASILEQIPAIPALLVVNNLTIENLYIKNIPNAYEFRDKDIFNNRQNTAQ